MSPVGRRHCSGGYRSPSRGIHAGVPAIRQKPVKPSEEYEVSRSKVRTQRSPAPRPHVSLYIRVGRVLHLCMHYLITPAALGAGPR